MKKRVIGLIASVVVVGGLLISTQFLNRPTLEYIQDQSKIRNSYVEEEYGYVEADVVVKNNTATPQKFKIHIEIKDNEKETTVAYSIDKAALPAKVYIVKANETKVIKALFRGSKYNKLPKPGKLDRVYITNN